MFLAFAVAGVDGGVRVQGFAYLGVTLGTEWIIYTVPLTLLTLLAAWWAGTGGRPTEGERADVVWRRLRPPILTVAALALPTAAAGIARLVNTVANFSNGGPTRTPELAESAGILVLAVAGAATQWLGARRLLRSAEPQAASEASQRRLKRRLRDACRKNAPHPFPGRSVGSEPVPKRTAVIGSGSGPTTLQDRPASSDR